MSLALFAYGSLASPASAGLTLGRPVEPPAAATLSAWRRRWSLARDNLACEKTFARADDGSMPPFCLALNLERDEGLGAAGAPNGALLAVSEAELERLDLRELRYDRIEVTGALPGARFDQVFAYVAKPDHHAPRPPAGAVVLAAYVRAVEAAFDELGEGELERFRSTTDPCPVEVVEGNLVRDVVLPGNPRGW